MRRGLPAVVAGVLLVAVGAPAQESGIVPVATVKQLCEGMITTSSDALFNVGREAPDDDDDWRAVLHNALMLAEAGNLLMLEGRARDDGEWMTMSRALVDAGITAVRAVEVRDVDALLGAGDEIVVACETCHVPYRDEGLSMPVR